MIVSFLLKENVNLCTLEFLIGCWNLHVMLILEDSFLDK